MSGDYTRFTFDPVKGFSGLLKQQGRVSLDADFNEFEEILDRRSRAEMFDVVGQTVVPETTPHGFEISFTGPGKLAIGRGRAYVDGILAECFGDLKAGSILDPNLNGLHGPDTPGIDYDKQPFYYSAPIAYPAPSGGTDPVDLVYLDVWQREMTMYEEERLLDVALGGRDTANRVQTAWQVKIFKDASLDATSCENPPQAWTDFIAPSSARMTADVGPPPQPPGPCIINPAGGYTGRENRLYRVEIHESGTLGSGTATFKWSRDNASLQATVVKSITLVGAGPHSLVTVDSTGRDSWLRFEAGDTVEVLDDFVEFSMRETGKGGRLAKIVSIDEANAQIEVDQDFTGFVDTARHARIRRWDVAQVPAPDPAKRVVDNVTTFKLEQGITVKFEGAGTDTLHAGDFWVFAARTADGKIDEVKSQPPRGILHHYARLALIKNGALIDDCRVMWPPKFGGDTCCDCSACVSADDFAADPDAIQKAIDKVTAAGGGTVCIGVGFFELKKGLTVTDAVSVHIHGVGAMTVLWFVDETGDAALRIEKSLDVAVRDLTVITLRTADQAWNAIEIADSAGVWVERVIAVENALAVLEFLDAKETDRKTGAAIALDGLVAGVLIRECLLAGQSAVASMALIDITRSTSLVVSNLEIATSLLYGIDYGVQLGGQAAIEDGPGAMIYYSDRTRIADTSVFGCREIGVNLSGIVLVGQVEIDDNVVHVLGTGIVFDVPHCTVAGNDVTGAAESDEEGGAQLGSGNGIEVVGGLSEADHCRILGNRIEGFAGAGIWFDYYIEAGLVKQNIVRACAGGIVCGPFNRFFGLSVANNAVHDLTGTFLFWDFPLSAGILLNGAEDTEVLDNSVRRIGSEGDAVDWRAGIQLIGCPSVRVGGNEVLDIEPVRGRGSAGIASALAFDRLDVHDNRVELPQLRGPTREFALLIGPVDDDDLWEQLAGMLGDPAPKPDLKKPPNSQNLTGRESLAGVRGNVLECAGGRAEAGGPSTVALITTGGHCVFGENRCRIRLASKGEVPVKITAETLALSTNQVLQKGGNESVDAHVPPVSHGAAITVLGNLTSRPIRVNNAGLTANWKPLNIVLG
jgi:Family of unknown function (DUF6519)